MKTPAPYSQCSNIRICSTRTLQRLASAGCRAARGGENPGLKSSASVRSRSAARGQPCADRHRLVRAIPARILDRAFGDGEADLDAAEPGASFRDDRGRSSQPIRRRRPDSEKVDDFARPAR